MSQAKKFGAFAGVFTPSILTILGVIMYLRLGWVVGESGLISAILIILLAHVISVSTGLSISSIATDKKIRTGGIYYMLSRSLGLPMGGAIGITIFIGTALSIALYLVGFAENFLSIEVIRDFLHLDASLNAIRMVGTAAILFLVLLAFVSTSLAIRSQYFILGAIVLSLISIMAGLFVNVQYHPEVPLLHAREGALSFDTVFAIFFPAVTGFTAGVAMSGDLKDPKKAIPKGTLWAIVTGLIVYLALAVSFGFFVNRDLLVNDYNFLMKIALWSPFVVAGIWGATLSSALGGILGAPRILQAIAKDKILPRIFSIGHGSGNEPRNALLLTFVIAEAGILIGRLDVIARVVTMFYIAAYGFINLAYVLESWASSDFRPSFKISRWIGIIGFVASFSIMFKLDTVAMILAIVIMFAIYLLLAKRALRLDFGDVWQSVWASIVRSSLTRIAKKGLETRNWKPNIILFSGGTNQRPYLIEFGKDLVGRQGFLTNFDLIESDEETVMQRQNQIVAEDEEFIDSGIFSRRHTCKDIYEGIRTIAATYGFSGIEPNTVMLGWARQSEKPVLFINTINYLMSLDLNIVLMDYDKDAGFGKQNRIDIWWRTTEYNGNLALMLLKFLWLSDNWRNAKARILIVNPVDEQREAIQRNTGAILDSMRISAEVKVINNEIEKRSFYDIVQVESVNSDLIMLSLPEIKAGNEAQFVNETNNLCKDIGTVILIKASTNFKKLRIGIKRTLLSQLMKPKPAARPAGKTALPETTAIRYPEKPEIAGPLRLLNHDLKQINDYYTSVYLSKLFDYQENLIDLVKEAVDKSITNISEKVCPSESGEQYKNIVKYKSNLLFRIRKIIEDFEKDIFEIQFEKLSESIDYYFGEIDKVIINTPKKLKIVVDKTVFEHPQMKGFGNLFFRMKLKTGSLFSAAPPHYHLHYRHILHHYLQVTTNRHQYNLLNKLGIASLQNAVKGNRFIEQLGTVLNQLEQAALTNELNEQLVKEKQAEIADKIEELKSLNDTSRTTLEKTVYSTTNEIIQKLADEMNRPNANRAFEKYDFDGATHKNFRQMMRMAPDVWRRNQTLLFNSSLLELALLSFNTKLRLIFNTVIKEFIQLYQYTVIDKQQHFQTYLGQQLTALQDDTNYKFNPESFTEFENREQIQSYLNQVIENTFRKIKLAASTLPENIELMDESALNNFYKEPFKNANPVTISVSKLMDYLLQSEFLEPLQESFAELPQKIEKVSTVNQETLRNIAFALEAGDDNQHENGAGKEKMAVVFRQQMEWHSEEMKKSQELQKQITNIFRERLNGFEDKLFLHSFVKTANNLRQYIRDIESRKRWNWLMTQRNKTETLLRHLISQFWYKQGHSTIFTQKAVPQRQEAFQVNESLDLVESLSASPEIMRKLPFHYKQLFLRKQYFLNEFWVGRREELAEAAKAVDRYRQGISGGLLITGDHNSGKTFFAQYFINRHYHEANVFNLTAPYGGAADINLFKKTIENTFEARGSYYKLFNTLPENSVLIIDDLELWWEKSNDGYAVVHLIIDLIKKYGNRCLFVVSVNRYCFEVLKKTVQFDHYFLNVIELRPFGPEELQKTILQRHNSTSMKLLLSNSRHERIRSWDFARLFASFYAYSQGNVGMALQAWLSNITEIENHTIYIRQPKIPELSLFDALEPQWDIFIVQLILHKRAGLRKISRVCHTSIADTKNTIEMLKRSGIVTEINPGIYGINTFIYSHILMKMIEKEML